ARGEARRVPARDPMAMRCPRTDHRPRLRETPAARLCRAGTSGWCKSAVSGPFARTCRRRAWRRTRDWQRGSRFRHLALRCDCHGTSFTDMPTYRSRTSTHGRNMAGARALWRATGMQDDDFQKPIIAIANSFTQFVPGHVHLHDVGQRVKEVVDAAGGWGVEFNTIAVDDGIAMGHDGMLYSLPSRELIADSVEYMVNAHCADALICISN